VFLIGEIKGGVLNSLLVNYTKAKDLQEGTDSLSETFVDQLDLEGNGTDEIITEIRDYEFVWFSVYKRLGNIWKTVASGEGC
jgi:hypothetical protein